MSNRGLYQTALVFAVLTALGWILFVVGTLGSGQAGGAGVVESYLAGAESSATLLYTWGGVLGSLSVIPVFLAFFQGFRQQAGSVLAVPVTLAIVGVAFLTLGFMVDTGSLIYQFGPAVAAAQDVDRALLVNSAQLAQDSIEVTWAVGSFLAYGGSIVWMAILLLRANAAAGWLNWAGILGGLAGFVWLVRFIPVPAPQSAAFILIFANIIFTVIWLVGGSITLVRRGEDGTVRPT